MSAGTRQPCLSLSVHPKSTPATTSKSSRSPAHHWIVRARCGFPARALCFCRAARLHLSRPAGCLSPSAKRTLRNDLTSETKEVSFGIAPSFARQPGFPAGLLEELLARQLMFDRDLGKQQAAFCLELDKKSVKPNCDRLRGDRFYC